MTGILFRLRGGPMVWKIIMTTLIAGSGSRAMIKRNGDILRLDHVGIRSHDYGIEDSVTTRSTN